jgi:hypothetical protein
MIFFMRLCLHFLKEMFKFELLGKTENGVGGGRQKTIWMPVIKRKL